MEKRYPLYQISIDSDDTFGVDKVSLVDMPAVESNWQYFEKQENKFMFSVQDEEEHKVLGCILRADYPIYRRNGDFEFYVNFSKDVIKQIAERFLKENNQNRINLQHSIDTKGAVIEQLFIKDTDRGITPKGFDDVSDGSLFGVYHIVDEDLWNEIKNGTFNGFSVEIVSTLIADGEIEEQFNSQNVENEVLAILDEIENKLKSLKL